MPLGCSKEVDLQRRAFASKVASPGLRKVNGTANEVARTGFRVHGIWQGWARGLTPRVSRSGIAREGARERLELKSWNFN